MGNIKQKKTIRTAMIITEGQDRELERIAKEEITSKSFLIREAINKLVEERKKKKKK